MTSAEQRWLDQDQQLAWVAVLQLSTRLPAVLDAQLQRESGLTLFEYFVLSRLSMASDRTLRMSELAELAIGSLSRLSNVVKRLEQRGLITRRPDPHDGRITVASLSEQGWQQVVAAAPGHVGAVRRVLIDALSPGQLDDLAASARIIAARLRDEGSCPPAC